MDLKYDKLVRNAVHNFSVILHNLSHLFEFVVKPNKYDKKQQDIGFIFCGTISALLDVVKQNYAHGVKNEITN